MFKQFVLSCLIAGAAPLPQGIRSGPLTPAYGDLVQTPRGLVPLSLEGFSEDVNRDGFVDPVVQTGLPLPVAQQVALPAVNNLIGNSGFASNFAAPVATGFPARQVIHGNGPISSPSFASTFATPLTSGFPARQIAAGNVAFGNQRFANNFALPAGVDFDNSGFANNFAAPVQQVPAANTGFGNAGFASNFAAPVQQVAAADSGFGNAGFAPNFATTNAAFGNPGFGSTFTTTNGRFGNPGFASNFAAAIPAQQIAVGSPNFQTNFVDQFAGGLGSGLPGQCVNNWGAAVPCAL